jgi:lysine 2,3-aminomutase
MLIAPSDMEDPCGEDHHMVTPGLVHRYPDRVLLLALDTCAAYCRYCTRSRLVGAGEMGPSMPRLEAAFAYLRAHEEVRDVLISGGDPLLMADEKIHEILTKLRAIPHIEFVRLGTRIPCFLPQRITPGLVAALRAGGPAWLSLHFSHPRELTPEVVKACNLLADGGIPLGNQTVLLKGINDDAHVLRKLFHELLKIRVRPYYLYQCDPVTGTSHLRTSVATGLAIMEQLRGHTSGYAVPTYVIDAPGGGGKIPISPGYVLTSTNGHTVLRNFRGETFHYHDPCTVSGPNP